VSDTPRTDRAAFYPGLNDDYDDFSIDGTCVYATVARGLERENNALRGKVEQLERAILRYAHIEETLASTVRGLEFELEKANAALDLLNTHCMSADPIMGRSTYRWTIEHDEPDIRAFIDELRKVTRA